MNLTTGPQEEFKLTYDWTIKGLRMVPYKTDDFFVSPVFHSTPRPVYSSRMELCCINPNYLYSKVTIKQVPQCYPTYLTMSLSYMNEEKSSETKSFPMVLDVFIGTEDYSYTFSLFPIDELKHHEKTLTITLNATLKRDIPSSSSNMIAIPVFKSNFPMVLWDLFQNKHLSDVTLVVQEKEYYAHKVILSARSPIFKAMFSHKMRENRQNKVAITDIEPTHMEIILKYLYTDEIEDLHSLAQDLLPAADKYALHHLKALCEKALLENLTVENAATTLCLADRHSCQELKTRVVKFIHLNVHKLQVTESWIEMVLAGSTFVKPLIRNEQKDENNE